MSQISPPIRVLAVCAIAFLAAWMLFLRPKPEEVAPPTGTEPAATAPAPTAEPGSAAGEAVAQANAAAATANGRASDLTGEASAPATTGGAPGGGTAAAAGEDSSDVDPKVLRKLPAGVRRAIRRDRVLVLLFWNRRSAEDRRVKRSLGRVDRWDGRVFVHDADVRRVARYAAITRGANVEQSPTVIVVDRNLKAETLVGFVDTPTMDQAVLDALREPAPLFTDTYLRKVNQTCRILNDAFVAQADPSWPRRRVARWLRVMNRVLTRFDREFAAIAAPAKWRGFKRAAQRDHEDMRTVIASLERQVRRGSRARVRRIVQRDLGRFERLEDRYEGRMKGKHLLGCSRGA